MCKRFTPHVPRATESRLQAVPLRTETGLTQSTMCWASVPPVRAARPVMVAQVIITAALKSVFRPASAMKMAARQASTVATCSGLRCHGGQNTPSWSTGTLDVNAQCTSCHQQTTSQYNGYFSGEHNKHVNGENMACVECHSVSKLANGSGGNTHFSNLQSTTFELSPGLTVGGSDLSPSRNLNWNDSSNTCNLRCHGKSHDSGDRW